MSRTFSISSASTTADLAEVAAFFDTDSGDDLALAWNRATVLEEEHVLAGIETLATPRTEAPDRLTLYETMIERLNAVETGTAMALTFSYALTMGMIGGASADVRLDPAASHMMFQGARGEVEAALTEQLPAVAAMTCSSFTVAKLERIIAFIETPAYQAFNDMMNAKIGAVLWRHSERFGATFVRLLEERESQRRGALPPPSLRDQQL